MRNKRPFKDRITNPEPPTLHGVVNIGLQLLPYQIKTPAGVATTVANGGTEVFTADGTPVGIEGFDEQIMDEEIHAIIESLKTAIFHKLVAAGLQPLRTDPRESQRRFGKKEGEAHMLKKQG